MVVVRALEDMAAIAKNSLFSRLALVQDAKIHTLCSISPRVNISEGFPSSYSNIRIWMSVSAATSPVYDMTLLGTDGSIKNDIFWTISTDDHPARMLYGRPYQVLEDSVLCNVK